MALAKEIYQALESIVGKRNISEDPAITQTYRCITSQSSAHYGPFNHWTPCPQAVLLPGSTEEVQQIVRLCNKYDIHFKAASTFWAAMGFISTDNSIQLDMKRMVKIEIDPKNMIAVVEPYAQSFQLFHENDILYLGHRQFNMFGRDIKTAMIKILTDPEKQK